MKRHYLVCDRHGAVLVEVWAYTDSEAMNIAYALGYPAMFTNVKE
jgi:hypothetical protein